MNNELINKVAEEYSRDKTEENRNKLIEISLPNIKRIARMIHRRCKNIYDYEDILSFCYENIFKVIEKYNSKYKFSTWMFFKLKMNVLDFIRNDSNNKKMKHFRLNRTNNMWLEKYNKAKEKGLVDIKEITKDMGLHVTGSVIQNIAMNNANMMYLGSGKDDYDFAKTISDKCENEENKIMIKEIVDKTINKIKTDYKQYESFENFQDLIYDFIYGGYTNSEVAKRNNKKTYTITRYIDLFYEYFKEEYILAE
jgi:RNA polymerase sigma factor (sigma-70 family)